MKIRFLKNGYHGDLHYRGGDVLEVPDGDAKQLIAAGTAQPASRAEEKSPEGEKPKSDKPKK